MSSLDPDIVVAFGTRSVLSLVGIVVVVVGVWRTDRTWDEEGSKAFDRALAADGSTAAAPDEKTPITKPPVVISKEELDAAFPPPWMFWLGWTLFGISYLFEEGDALSTFTTNNAANLLGLVFSLLIAVVASKPMGETVKNRDNNTKTKLSMVFALSWVGLTVATIFSNSSNGLVASIFNPIGMVCIIASMKILWKHRKMGDSWEQMAMPNPKPVVYNAGGPLFVFGWFLFWVGLSSTNYEEDATGFYVPIYFTWRSLLAFAAGTGMVPIVMFVDYAHDEGSEYVGFGTDGRFFGRFLESPIPFLLSWTVFGIAGLLPFDGDGVPVRGWLLFVNCVLQGIDAGVLIQTALWKQDLASKTKWSIPFVILFVLLAVNLGLNGGISWLLSFGGAILIVLGQKTVFGDRKRGDYWMENGTPNPNPIVYSAGEPLFMAGWIMMSLAMSIPLQ